MLWNGKLSLLSGITGDDDYGCVLVSWPLCKSAAVQRAAHTLTDGVKDKRTMLGFGLLRGKADLHLADVSD